MGNINHIFNKEGKHVGTMDFGLRTFSVVTRIIEKYIPGLNFFTLVENGSLDEKLEIVYNNCTPAEKVMMLLFINDISEFTEEDIPAFETAIDEYPEAWPEQVLQLLKSMRKMLAEHKWLKKTYENTMVQTTIEHADGTKTMEVGIYDPKD